MESTLTKSPETTLDRIHEIIRFVSPELDGRYEPADRLGDLGVDSLSLVEVLVQVEKRFDFAMTDDDIAMVETIQDILDVIEQHS